MSRGLATGLAIVAFTGLLAWLSLRGGGAECEACMAWEGRRHCTSVRGESREAAQEAAIRGACGVLGGSMTGELACTRRAPESLRCEP